VAKRTYGQNCALARTADLLGERWTLLMLRDLLIRPRRYGELLTSLKGMGTNLLASRLDQLEEDGLLERASLEPGASGYQLTARGLLLEPAVLELIRWGLTDPRRESDGGHHRDEWDLLAAKALFDSKRASRVRATVSFQADGERVRVTVCRGAIGWSFDEGASDAEFLGTLSEVPALLARGGGAHRSKVRGDEQAFARFLGCFSLAG